MRLDIAASSHVGRVRTNNEDMALASPGAEGRAYEYIRDSAYATSLVVEEGRRALLFAVADGMGGHHAGDIASRTALESFAATEAAAGNADTPAALESFYQSWAATLHARLLVMADEYGAAAAKVMGTTLVAFVYRPDWGTCHYLSAGDSRLYCLRGGFLRQITRDHTRSELMNDHEEGSGWRLANALGGGNRQAWIDFGPVRDDILSGDLLLMATDGLTGLVSDDAIEESLAEAADLAAAANQLVNHANASGGPDNVTVLLARFSEDKP